MTPIQRLASNLAVAGHQGSAFALRQRLARYGFPLHVEGIVICQDLDEGVLYAERDGVIVADSVNTLVAEEERKEKPRSVKMSTRLFRLAKEAGGGKASAFIRTAIERELRRQGKL